MYTTSTIVVTQGFQINFTYSKKYQNKSNMKKRKIRNIRIKWKKKEINKSVNEWMNT